METDDKISSIMALKIKFLFLIFAFFLTNLFVVFAYQEIFFGQFLPL